MESELYTITGAKSFNSNSDYNISITTHKIKVPIECKYGIRGCSEQTCKYDNYKTVVIPPLTTKIVSLKIEKPENGDYMLYAEGIKGLKFKNEMHITYNSHSFNIYVKTEKSIYRPGDVVKFIVMFLDGNLKGVNLCRQTNVTIYDPLQNAMQAFQNIDIINGIYSSEYKLPTNPIQGHWSVGIAINDCREAHPFEVWNRVVPVVEVLLKVNPSHVIEDGNLKMEISSFYKTGQPVKGEATIVASFRSTKNIGPPIITTKKSSSINGKVMMELSMSELKLEGPTRLKLCASVCDELTGKLQNSYEIKINMQSTKPKLLLESPIELLKPGLPFHGRIIVNNYDKIVKENRTSDVKVNYEIQHIEDEEIKKFTDITGELKLSLNDKGTVDFQISTPLNVDCITCTCNYMDLETSIEKIFDPDDSKQCIQARLLTESPKINSDVNIEVETLENIEYFNYFVIGRGNILMSDMVKMPKNNKNTTFKFMATSEMSLNINVLVYYIKKSGVMTSDVLKISFEPAYSNFIKIKPLNGDLLKPGDDVEFTIETKPNSVVGLFSSPEDSELNFFDGQTILYWLSSFESPLSQNIDWCKFPDHEPYPSIFSSGLIILTNAKPVSDPCKSYDADDRDAMLMKNYRQGRTIKRINSDGPNMFARKFFPEKWFYDILNSGSDGKLKITRKLPLFNKKWMINAFSIDKNSGYSTIADLISLDIKEPLSVSTFMPHSIKLGESFLISVTLNNTTCAEIDAKIAINNLLAQFEFIDNSGTESVTIKSNELSVISFKIRPIKLGVILITTIINSQSITTKRESEIIVENGGVIEHINKNYFIDLRENSEYSNEILIETPADVVENSITTNFTAINDLLSLTIQNIIKLIYQPTGCGEQNMIHFSPNVSLLKYLISNNILTNDLKEKLITNLREGYSNELIHKHEDGSFGPFDPNMDMFGCTWLTALVAKNFIQASEFIEINNDIVKKSLDWLSSIQSPNGCFTEVGYIFQKDLHGGKGFSYGLTSFVLLAFLQNEDHQNMYKEIINKALGYILESHDKTEDIYSIAVSAYVLQLNKHASGSILLEKLRSHAKQSDGMLWWEKKQNENTIESVFNIELTSYGLLTYLEAGLLSESTQIAKWLIMQLTDIGGFSYSQATVMGIDALSKFSDKVKLGNQKLQVHAILSDEIVKSFELHKNNEMELQCCQIPETINTILLKAKGNGMSIAQVSYRYKSQKSITSKFFNLDVNATTNHPYVMDLSVSVTYNPLPDENDICSNMLIIEVEFPSGFLFDTDTIALLRGKGGVRKIETRNADKLAVFYVNRIDKSGILLNLCGIKTFETYDRKPSSVIVYDYYENDRRARTFYSV